MRIFLDTASIDQIRQAAKLGIISGVTTNPSLMSKEGEADYQAVIKEICSIIPGPISAEVLVEKAESMIEQARQISTWAPNVVIKIPATAAGVEATSALARDNIKVNFTLCFSLNQALLGALAGATYISLFVGRLDDIGADGIEFVSNIKDTYTLYGYQTEVLAASIRSIDHVTSCISVAADICTIPVKIFNQLLAHPLTQKGQAKFLADFKSSTNA